MTNIHYPTDIDARTTTEFFIITSDGVRISYSAPTIVHRVISYGLYRPMLQKVIDTIEANCGWNATGLFKEDIEKVLNMENR